MTNTTYSKIFWASDFPTQRLISKAVLGIQDLLKETMEDEEECLEAGRSVMGVLLGSAICADVLVTEFNAMLELSVKCPEAALESAAVLLGVPLED